MLDRGARRSRRSFVFSAVGAVTLVAGVAAYGPALGAATPTVSLTVSPVGLMKGQQVTGSGTASTTQNRPVQLQHLGTDQAWDTVASGTTSGSTYSLTDPASEIGSYRVVLPAAKVGSTSLPQVVSATRAVISAVTLPNGATMNGGQYLTSSDGRYRLYLAPDGNLRYFEVARSTANLWQSGTGGNNGARLVMQYRGNLVLVATDGRVLWQTGTTDAAQQALLTLDRSGNFFVRTGTTVLWDRLHKLDGSAPTTTLGASAIERGDSWVAAKVPYSQSRWYKNKYGSFRQDCSGFVSLMWSLNTSYTTRTIPSISTTISKSSLRAGDVLNAPNYHVVLFDKWANDEHTKYWAYEETPSSGAAHHVIPYPYYSSSRPGSFVPRRLSAAKTKAMAGRAGTMSQGSDAGPVGR